MDFQYFKAKSWQITESIGQVMKKLMIYVAEQEKLSLTQATILCVLHWEKEHMTMRELGFRFDRNQGNLSTLCKKMEQDGYIQKHRGIQDERVVYIQLTKQGREAVIRMEKSIDNIMKPVLTKAKKETLEKILVGFEEFEKLAKQFQRRSK